jgi:hypothetical protein
MSPRFNWMNFALGGFFLVCLLLAVLYGSYQRDKALDAQKITGETTQKVALANEVLKEKQGSYQNAVTSLGAPDDGREDSDFFALLQSLMRAAGVVPVQQQRVALEVLPTIGTGDTPVAAGSSATAATEEEKAKLNQPSLTNLPLGARAVTTRVEVQGNYRSIRNFLGQIYNFRFKKRAVNINSVQIAFADDKGALKATVNLTRFIYPKEDAQPTLSTDPLSEASRNRETSSAIEAARPDQRTPVRSGN